MKKLRPIVLSLVASVMAFSITALAAGNDVIRTFTGEDSVSIYVRGVSADEEVAAQVGTSEAVSVTATDIKDFENPIRTLILVDNSLSIPQNDRPKVKSLVKDIATNCLTTLKEEEIAIGLISESVSITCDYTNDFTDLASAADAIEFNDQETYLTDALADYIIDNIDINEDVLFRIIVISDGVDNKPVESDKKTPEQLKSILKEYSIPLYAIGCKTNNKASDEMLMGMKDLAISTPGEFCTLDMSDSTYEIADIFVKDLSVVRFDIVPEADQMDGTTKAVKLSVGGVNVTADIRMPQHLVEKAEPEVKETIVVVEKEAEATPTPEPTEEPEEEKPAIPPIMLYGLIAAAVVVFIIIIVLVIVLVVRGNKNRDGFEPIPDVIDGTITPKTEGERTVIVGEIGRSDHDGGTVMIWNNPQTYHIILTDVMSPAKTFQIPLSNSVVLGRRPGCDAVFDYEKSVSGRHCEISVKSGKFYIRDLQSSNGTFVNGSKVLTEVEIFAGNRIKMGRLEVKFDVR